MVSTMENHCHFSRASKRLVTVEPIILLINFIQGAHLTTRSQYVEHRLADEKNYTLPIGNVCSHNTGDETEKWIESETASWLTYMTAASVFPPAIMVILLGAASDFVGRRPMFIITSTGHFLASGLFLLIAIYQLPLWLLVVGEFTLGVAGDTILVSTISEAYVADIYFGRSRTLRIVVVEAVSLFAYGIIQFITGEILRATVTNFILVYSIIVGIAFVNLLYVAIPYVLLETVKQRSFSCGVLKDVLTNVRFICSSSNTGSRLHLSLLFLISFLWTMVLSFDAIGSTIIVYGLSTPFCWTPETVGAYGAIFNTIPSLVALVTMPLSALCFSSSNWMVYAGFTSGIAFLLATALAPTTLWLAYIAPVFGMFSLLPLPIAKSKVSEQVDASLQGVALGLVGVVMSIALCVSPIIFNGILRYEVDRKKANQPAVTFYVAAAVLILPIGINAILQVIIQSRSNYEILDGQNIEHHSDHQTRI